ncbi:MAG: hypothetical protein EB059_05700 [Alphaproteobacteria bacterium]|nr:hypothetical protein [Alphaproteobacteria bacterium]
MRKTILILLAAFLFMCAPHMSYAAGTCTLDEATVGGTDPMCPISGTNNFLPTQGYNSARLQPTNALSGTPININNVCRYVDARGITNPVFVPFNTPAEWNAFLANNPAGTNVSARCCVARSMVVGDVPEPTDTCNGGNWNLQGLVTSFSATTYLARPAGQNPTSEINLVASVIEDSDYPVDTFPFQRDDIGAMLPKGTRASDTYIARWQCLGRQTVGVNSSANTHRTSINGAVIGNINGEIGDIAFTLFKLQCRNAAWTSIDPSTCVETITQATQTCVQAGHPATWTGSVQVLQRKNCPAGNITASIAFDSCVAPTCTPSDTPSTVECPSGQSGNIIRRTIRTCDGSNGGAGSVSTVDDTSQCVAACVPGQVGANFSESCGVNFTGTATFKNMRTCPVGTPGGVITKTEVSNSCVCPASTDLGNITKVCPIGQTGTPVVRQVKTCVQALPSGSGIQSWGICSCTIAETPVSGSCIAACVAGDTVTTAPCPIGQSGNITRRTVRTCDGSNGGTGSVVVTDDVSQCSATCVPGQVGDTFVESCGANFNGSATFKNVRACPSGAITKTEVSNTCACPASTNLGPVIKACPSGQIGGMLVQQVKTCAQALPAGGLQSWGFCSCSTIENPIVNGCVSLCTPIDTTVTAACPSGQTGTVTRRIVRVCDGSNGGLGNLTTTDDISQCVPATVCVPGQVGNTFQAACPIGQVGVVTKRTVRACPSGTLSDEVVSSTCAAPPVSCIPGEISRSAVDCGINMDGMIVTIVNHICDGSNNGAGRDVATIDNQCRASCIPTGPVVTQEACPSGQQGYIKVTTRHVCHSRMGSNGWEACGAPSWWDNWIDGGARDIVVRENFCTPIVQCTPSDTSSTAACPSGYDGQILVRTQHICDGSNNGAGRNQITETNQCRLSCVAGPTCNPYSAPCPSGQTGQIVRQDYRLCPSGNIEIREISNTCVNACIPSNNVTDASCPAGQLGKIVTTRAHICDGSNNGAGRDTITIDNQCRNACVPATSTANSACPSGQTGNIVTTTQHVCDGSNGGLGRDQITISNQCHYSCTAGTTTASAACPSGQTGQIVTTTQHVCNGANNGAGMDIISTVNQCQLSCTPTSSSVNSACPSGQTGTVTTTTAHVCDGSNNGAGKDVVTVNRQCQNICTPGSSSVNSACPSGQSGQVTTTTTHICDGSNNGSGRDTITTTNTCVNTCVAGSTSINSACPSGQAGQITTTTAHICDGSNNGGGRDVVTTNNQCTVIQLCTPSELVTCSSCPAGQVGTVTTTRRHICDGSNGGVGRDTISTSSTCRPRCTSSSSASSGSSSSASGSGWSGSVSISASANASANASAGCSY